MRLRTVPAALALAAAAATGAVMPGTAASAGTTASCPDNNWRTWGAKGYHFAVAGANIRTGPSTSCTSLGLGYPSHVVRLDCQKAGWTHVHNETTGTLGWVRNDMLASLPPITC
ncbi:SH3 domain-containing protein [Plantactinospora sp. GCM10030261]|uniref:SH3 domain-containing protein n=1 Tax=Plantactinospora sp. GCM10030261 TaxID=3273420 RepID=UPI00361E1526